MEGGRAVAKAEKEGAAKVEGEGAAKVEKEAERGAKKEAVEASTVAETEPERPPPPSQGGEMLRRPASVYALLFFRGRGVLSYVWFSDARCA